MKQIQPNEIVGFFHGIDPASQNDYYTDVVHVLPQKPRTTTDNQAKEFKWIPYPVYIFRTRKIDPNEIIDLQIKIFNKFPPTFMTIDGSREEFLANSIKRKYGESRMEIMKFLNSGQSNVKFKLKQLGYAAIESGYEWPDIFQLEKTAPKQARLFKILKTEMLHEQVKYTRNQRVTFDAPIGKHNDLVHGWEMSLNSVMKFQERNLGYEKRQVTEGIAETIYDQIYEGYESEERESDAVYDREGISRLPFR